MPETGTGDSIERADAYVGKAWRRLTRGEAYIGGGWKEIASFVPPMMLSAPPAVSTARPVTVVPQYVVASSTVSVSGGEGPFTYLWTIVSGSVTILQQGMATASFGSSVEPFEVVNAVVRCTVTDSNSTQATVDVAVTLRNQPTV